ncbi:MAG: hypothetical protein K2I03_13235 [Lachnospiraceae bacterium]|nr:hypothetical protein [Lachnospiraceae bacterium]
MIIKKIAVGNSTEAFVEDSFTEGLNIISSDDNNKGKTIAMQSMMYAIGNEPTFPTTFDYKKYYYYKEFEENNKIYRVCRYGENFALIEEKTLLLFDSVSELKRYWTKHIFKLPEIVKNQISKIVDPVLFFQLFFVGQDKKDTSNISHSGLYNKKDFEEMIYSILNLSGYKLDLEEIEKIKAKLTDLKDEKKLLLKQHKILSSKKAPVQYLSAVNDRLAFENKVEQMDKINAKITELRKARNLAANRKSKWENTIKELKSLNRNIDVGELKCMDCDSKNIAYATSTKRTAYVFDVSTVEMRNDIINSIYEKIDSYDEEIEKYDISIAKEQEKLRLMMNDEEITLEALIELKEQIFSASDAELRILEIEQEIKSLQSKLSISETSSEETKNKREAVINVILSEMNTLYKAIDPNGNLVFKGLFTKKDEVFSGSEATIFHVVKMFALQKVLGHNWPIIIDSFRAEDLSTGKEKVVIEKYKELDNQIIFTTTLKDEEMGKYDNRPEINHIDYKGHAPSKMLSPEYCEHFKQLVADFAFDIK